MSTKSRRNAYLKTEAQTKGLREDDAGQTNFEVLSGMMRNMLDPDSKKSQTGEEYMKSLVINIYDFHKNNDVHNGLANIVNNAIDKWIPNIKPDDIKKFARSEDVADLIDKRKTDSVLDENLVTFTHAAIHRGIIKASDSTLGGSYTELLTAQAGLNSSGKKFEHITGEARKVVEVVKPEVQCDTAMELLPEIIKKTCWICQEPLNEGPPPAECEHMFPLLDSFRYTTVQRQAKRVFEKLDIARQRIYELEYRWSHQCCNQIKKDMGLVYHDLSKNKYSLNETNSSKLLKTIAQRMQGNATDAKGNPTTTGLYDCEKILNGKNAADIISNLESPKAVESMGKILNPVFECMNERSRIIGDVLPGVAMDMQTKINDSIAILSVFANFMSDKAHALYGAILNFYYWRNNTTKEKKEEQKTAIKRKRKNSSGSNEGLNEPKKKKPAVSTKGGGLEFSDINIPVYKLKLFSQNQLVEVAKDSSHLVLIAGCIDILSPDKIDTALIPNNDPHDNIDILIKMNEIFNTLILIDESNENNSNEHNSNENNSNAYKLKKVMKIMKQMEADKSDKLKEADKLWKDTIIGTYKGYSNGVKSMLERYGQSNGLHSILQRKSIAFAENAAMTIEKMYNNDLLTHEYKHDTMKTINETLKMICKNYIDDALLSNINYKLEDIWYKTIDTPLFHANPAYASEMRKKKALWIDWNRLPDEPKIGLYAFEANLTVASAKLNEVTPYIERAKLQAAAQALKKHQEIEKSQANMRRHKNAAAKRVEDDRRRAEEDRHRSGLPTTLNEARKQKLAELKEYFELAIADMPRPARWAEAYLGYVHVTDIIKDQYKKEFDPLIDDHYKAVISIAERTAERRRKKEEERTAASTAASEIHRQKNEARQTKKNANNAQYRALEPKRRERFSQLAQNIENYEKRESGLWQRFPLAYTALEYAISKKLGNPVEKFDPAINKQFEAAKKLIQNSKNRDERQKLNERQKRNEQTRKNENNRRLAEAADAAEAAEAKERANIMAQSERRSRLLDLGDGFYEKRRQEIARSLPLNELKALMSMPLKNFIKQRKLEMAEKHFIPKSQRASHNPAASSGWFGSSDANSSDVNSSTASAAPGSSLFSKLGSYLWGSKEAQDDAESKQAASSSAASSDMDETAHHQPQHQQPFQQPQQPQQHQQPFQQPQQYQQPFQQPQQYQQPFQQPQQYQQPFQQPQQPQQYQQPFQQPQQPQSSRNPPRVSAASPALRPKLLSAATAQNFINPPLKAPASGAQLRPKNNYTAVDAEILKQQQSFAALRDGITASVRQETGSRRAYQQSQQEQLEADRRGTEQAFSLAQSSIIGHRPGSRPVYLASQVLQPNAAEQRRATGAFHNERHQAANYLRGVYRATDPQIRAYQAEQQQQQYQPQQYPQQYPQPQSGRRTQHLWPEIQQEYESLRRRGYADGGKRKTKRAHHKKKGWNSRRNRRVGCIKHGSGRRHGTQRGRKGKHVTRIGRKRV